MWVPSHCGLIGNDWADKAVADGAKLDQAGVVCHYDVTKSRIVGAQRKRSIEHERSRKVYAGGGIQWEKERDWSRQEAISYRRFRMGHSLELGAYRKRIGLQEVGTCRRCGEEEEDFEHVLLHCPAA